MQSGKEIGYLLSVIFFSVFHWWCLIEVESHNKIQGELFPRFPFLLCTFKWICFEMLFQKAEMHIYIPLCSGPQLIKLLWKPTGPDTQFRLTRYLVYSIICICLFQLRNCLAYLGVLPHDFGFIVWLVFGLPTTQIYMGIYIWYIWSDIYRVAYVFILVSLLWNNWEQCNLKTTSRLTQFTSASRWWHETECSEVVNACSSRWYWWTS